MQYLFLMCGPAFSGKTVLSTAIAAARGCARISLDEINDERGLPPGGEGLPAEEWERSSLEAVRRMKIAMGQSLDVVVDDTCCFRFLRDRYRAVAEDFGYTSVVVLMDVEEAELYRRLEANRERPERPDFRDELFRRHLEEFERPEPDERTVVFRPGQDGVEAWVSRMREWSSS